MSRWTEAANVEISPLGKSIDLAISQFRLKSFIELAILRRGFARGFSIHFKLIVTWYTATFNHLKSLY
jgi:hypothetical protein